MNDKSRQTLRSGEGGSWLQEEVRDFLIHSPENTLANQAKDRAFEEAIVGFSRGDDPLYDAYKERVGSYHWTPLEIFARTFPGEAVTAGELTVIAWVVAHNPLTKQDNRRERFYPAERWARARIFGEEVNEKLRRHVVAALEAEGFAAVAPALSPHWEQKASERYVYASTWSERHAAYASGLGTFGLCDGLITPLGKAVRVGSVIARIQLPPTPRPYKDHHEYCLFYSRGTCKKCISRCPVGALSESGHDKIKCRSHVRPVTEEYVKAHYGFDGYGCGLCQTGVPCESRIPLPSEGQ
ncbi:MAG: epoxyqueuosine reductase [Desulfobacterota bacterium]|jgi:epoxyqueuosine reductase QueG|nr:epoxyqueuosine reductase [Thermodesulfobacteriota bacterium]